MARPSGQATVEYMLLLFSALTLGLLTGAFLQKFAPQLIERLVERVFAAALTLAQP